MNLLSVENISKAFGERIILQNISFGINKDQKIAFIAKNGTGKTTLLNIMAGKDLPDSGQVVFRKGIHIGFLSQNPYFDEELTVEETIFATDNPILRLIQTYEHALQHPENEDAYQKAFEQMELHNAWDFETQYKQILFKLKLDNLQLKVKNLSGGRKKRLALANVLISKPDLLILDEPTNHLDLEMIEWLEQYFAKENLTLFIVTHDRYFLERVCNEILELDGGELFSYKGNYSSSQTPKRTLRTTRNQYGTLRKQNCRVPQRKQSFRAATGTQQIQLQLPARRARRYYRKKRNRQIHLPQSTYRSNSSR